MKLLPLRRNNAASVIRSIGEDVNSFVTACTAVTDISPQNESCRMSVGGERVAYSVLGMIGKAVKTYGRRRGLTPPHPLKLNSTLNY